LRRWTAPQKALLERVEELEKYASDFFGRLREVFAGNPDIKVVGDRFVFQSEVLFPLRRGRACRHPAAAIWINSPWSTSNWPRACRRICR
jgi:hypothetical protein